MKQIKTTTGTEIRMVAGGRSNVFIVSNNKLTILVDTGPAFIGKWLMKKLDQLSISSIDYLILTHTHFDHAANAKLIQDKFGAKVIVQANEAGMLLTGDSPIPAGINFLTSWLAGNLGRYLQKMVVYKSCKADVVVDDEFDFSTSGINARIIHTPGHSAGSQSLIVDNEIALVGDTLFGTYPGSCFPPFADHVSDLLESWERLLETGCNLFLPSHGRARTREMVESGLLKKRKSIN